MEKFIVPPREERWERIGEPKPPKMGGITPANVEIPDVDDLLSELERATKLSQKELKPCFYNCTCPPCLAGYCESCIVESRRWDAMWSLSRRVSL